MAELIYSIRNIFSTDKESCLTDYDAEKYHIAAYQRGYKWASDEFGAVTILLSDLKKAFGEFKAKGKKEYYLQYITLKNNTNGKYLEVIDGQQRLTTLSILISVLSYKISQDNIAVNKIEYAIRTNFFNDYIYKRDKLSEILDTKWSEFYRNDSSLNTQDIYYLFSAVQKINQVLSVSDDDYNKSFYDFILDNVKLIVNVVDQVSSEKVFSNLNSNKVALTETELIKGLLLTRVSRLNSDSEGKKHFREILEMRMNLGRKWDEIARWSNRPDISSFYFKKEEGMKGLLHLVAINSGKYANKKGVNAKDYPLFNFYHDNNEVESLYEAIIKMYSILNDWYEDTIIYNLLGFIFCSKGSEKTIENYLSIMDKDENTLRKHLIDYIKTLLPQAPEKLTYGNNEDINIHKALLALNVFNQPKNHLRFDFYRFVEEKWSLEHIFPQTPEGQGRILNNTDKESLKEMLGDSVTDQIEKVLEKEERNDEDKKLYQSILDGNPKLNSIGNMCLLTSGDNSSNGCSFFGEKRTNILERIQEGSFVPKHTFDVFSKMIFISNPGEFDRWTSQNIDDHTNRIKTILENLNFE